MYMQVLVCIHVREIKVEIAGFVDEEGAFEGEFVA